MRAVGAGPRHQFGMAVEQHRRAASWIAGASALTREIMVRWSVGFSRSSTAATSAAASRPGRPASSDDGSSTTGVAR